MGGDEPVVQYTSSRLPNASQIAPSLTRAFGRAFPVSGHLLFPIGSKVVSSLRYPRSLLVLTRYKGKQLENCKLHKAEESRQYF